MLGLTGLTNRIFYNKCKHIAWTFRIGQVASNSGSWCNPWLVSGVRSGTTSEASDVSGDTVTPQSTLYGVSCVNGRSSGLVFALVARLAACGRFVKVRHSRCFV